MAIIAPVKIWLVAKFVSWLTVESGKNLASLSSQFCNLESPIAVPEKRSTIHPHAQRNAFRRRDVRPQSRLFALGFGFNCSERFTVAE
jgi:hypothetical protein